MWVAPDRSVIVNESVSGVLNLRKKKGGQVHF